jgi:hypothetical protein
VLCENSNWLREVKFQVQSRPRTAFWSCFITGWAFWHPYLPQT